MIQQSRDTEYSGIGTASRLLEGDQMGLFSRKDWNVIAIIFERRDLYTVNGNRGQGNAAVAIRDGAKGHARTLFWAVFDQNRAFIEGAPGPARQQVAPETLKRLERNLPKLKTVQEILSALEKGTLDKAARQLEWDGYPQPKAGEA